MKYNYRGFGLNITSDIDFPELVAASFDIADVNIYQGVIIAPVEGKKIVWHHLALTITDNQLFLEAKGIARYLATDGRTIIVEPVDKDVDMRLLRLHILASVIAGALLQRKMLPMHASAILHHGELAFITGDSTAGKSTTLAGLIKKGYTPFSDDVVVLSPDLQTSASYPMIKLWEDAQEKLNHGQFSDQSFAIRKGMNKYGVFFHEQFDTGSHPVKKIFILKKGPVNQIESRQLKNAEAFNELTKQVYRKMLIHNNELKALTFQIISALSNNCIIYQVTRPEVCNVDALVEYVENLLLG
ncbi:hypothetical protein KXQ82_09810 [Mucilaginibacter sp. HMF5004]|uniref:hypothetical protein n=1 Tax=Mucilaginibacter rivuli TaxID=2857527 RepID=UPI001C5E2996|nr:hypothetical protein [Mucilaginibacter rivuli]MBW4890013.1 hypothetical protein [Mucilaginibacter rivuli]